MFTYRTQYIIHNLYERTRIISITHTNISPCLYYYGSSAHTQT